MHFTYFRGKKIHKSPSVADLLTAWVPRESQAVWVLTPEALGDEIVTLYVGPKQEKIVCHKKLLCDRCKYFPKAFCGGFQEAEKGEIYLEEDDPAIVTYLIDYLYRGTLPTDEGQTTGEGQATGEHSVNLARLYSLAEKLCMNSLMDKTCHAMRKCLSSDNKTYTPHNIKLVYSITCEGSKLRMYCAAIVACIAAKKDEFKASGGQAWGNARLQISDDCPDFFVDVFRWQLEHGREIDRRGKINAFDFVENFGPCEFHSHGSKDECYLKAVK